MIFCKPNLKGLLVMLLALPILSMTACNSKEPHSSDEIQKTENIKLDLIVSGSTDYTVVYDGENKTITSLVNDLIKNMNNKHGITLTSVAASEAKEDYGHEIVVGNVRSSAVAVVEKVKHKGDFAMCVSGDDWVLYATDDTAYTYMFDVLRNKILSRIKDGNFTVESINDFVYHDSELQDTSYAEYVRLKGNLSSKFIDQILESRKFKDSDNTVIPYRIYVPSNYDPEKQYPVLLFLHGAGERGNNNTSQLVHVIPNLFNNQKHSPVFDSILIVPQCPSGQQWVDTPWSKGNYDSSKVKESNELTAVVRLLESIGKEFSTDPNRYYVMGISMGGFGTWDLIMRHTDLFAGAVPICGGADVNQAENLINFPIYTAHGSADPTVPVSGTQAMVKALKNAGSKVITYVEPAGKGHNIWDEISANPEVINWLFEQNLANR